MDIGAVRWIHGAIDCERSADPPLQVVAIDDDTHVIRQSKCSNFEAPFLILLLGTERALLHDTGATADADAFPIRRTVDELLGGGDSSSSSRIRTATVTTMRATRSSTISPPGRSLPSARSEVAGFFGLEDWPAGRATLDLGDRAVDVIPSPGHLDDHVVLFDRTRGLLLSGDTLLPGRLTVRDWSAYRETVRRLARFARETAAGGHPIRQILGGHIEMDTAGELYELGTTYQPDEAPLPLSVDDLFTLEGALDEAGERPRRITRERFVVEPMEGA